MCIVEITRNDHITRYSFKGWREALDFADDMRHLTTYLRVYRAT